MIATGPISNIILNPEPPAQTEITVVMEQLDQRLADFLGPSISADKVAQHKCLRETDARSSGTSPGAPRSLTGCLDPPRVVTRPYYDHRHGRELPPGQRQSGFPQGR
jgi:hypothetical protein